LGVINQKQGKMTDAAILFARVIELNNGYVPVYFNLGELSLAQGDTAKAIRLYETFVSRWSGPRQAIEAVKKRMDSLR